MMLPIGLAVVNQFKTQLGPENEGIASNLGKNIMLGIAYSASIGGMATLIGTPTNAILAAVVKELYDYSIGFNEWMLFGFPFALLLLFYCWNYLVKSANPLPKRLNLDDIKSVISNQLKSLGNMGFEEKIVLTVFGLVCFAWITRSFLLAKLFPQIDDTIIVLVGVVLLFILPSAQKKRADSRLENCRKDSLGRFDSLWRRFGFSRRL
ncbi:SLC13 family permease [Algoriphagus boritolerans]|uniref:SLC13 family permease n=1 Tax=Algoriphagus boritolerans TaxID=308111 RepID=UPI000AD80681